MGGARSGTHVHMRKRCGCGSPAANVQFTVSIWLWVRAAGGTPRRQGPPVPCSLPSVLPSVLALVIGALAGGLGHLEARDEVAKGMEHSFGQLAQAAVAKAKTIDAHAGTILDLTKALAEMTAACKVLATTNSCSGQCVTDGGNKGMTGRTSGREFFNK